MKQSRKSRYMKFWKFFFKWIFIPLIIGLIFGIWTYVEKNIEYGVLVFLIMFNTGIFGEIVFKDYGECSYSSFD